MLGENKCVRDSQTGRGRARSGTATELEELMGMVAVRELMGSAVTRLSFYTPSFRAREMPVLMSLSHDDRVLC
jgi:hypothetical protein